MKVVFFTDQDLQLTFSSDVWEALEKIYNCEVVSDSKILTKLLKSDFPLLVLLDFDYDRAAKLKLKDLEENIAIVAYTDNLSISAIRKKQQEDGPYRGFLKGPLTDGMVSAVITDYDSWFKNDENDSELMSFTGMDATTAGDTIQEKFDMLDDEFSSSEEEILEVGDTGTIEIEIDFDEMMADDSTESTEDVDLLEEEVTPLEASQDEIDASASFELSAEDEELPSLDEDSEDDDFELPIEKHAEATLSGLTLPDQGEELDAGDESGAMDMSEEPAEEDSDYSSDQGGGLELSLGGISQLAIENGSSPTGEESSADLDLGGDDSDMFDMEADGEATTVGSIDDSSDMFDMEAEGEATTVGSIEDSSDLLDMEAEGDATRVGSIEDSADDSGFADLFGEESGQVDVGGESAESTKMSLFEGEEEASDASSLDDDLDGIDESDFDMDEEDDDLFDETPTSPRVPIGDVPNVSINELSDHAVSLKELKADREEVLQKLDRLESENEVLRRDLLTLKADYEEVKIESEILRKRKQEELEHLKSKLQVEEEKGHLYKDKIKVIQAELGRVQQKVRLDINQVRKRERELENQLELVKQDAQSQIERRDTRILELKRKIDSLEFNMENVTIQEQKMKDEKRKVEERLNRISLALKGSIEMLEDDFVLDEQTLDELEKL